MATECTAEDVLAYLLDLFPSLADDPVKSNALLYYCQAAYLAWFGEPMFPNRIEAWAEGPVVMEIEDEIEVTSVEPDPVIERRDVP